MQDNTVLQALDHSKIAGAVFPGEEHVTENLYVAFDDATEILHVKWQGEVDTKDFRDGYMHILRMVRFFKPSRWILDLQSRDSIKKEDQQWVIKNVFPQILRMLNQDVFIAVILPVSLYESLMHGLSGDEFIDKENLLIMNHFLYYEECVRWLQEVNVASERA
ncbi:hypothetical protein H8S95_04040 [Pontibacter sp. KCTC 32443]|uniref:hypothetical protein n=1 Tax=Pontibacter TaxID=323449 RepID=UPI00164D3E1F|nr:MULTISPECIES: hypothetical protein [Pontibacter]MBC5773224.1 hypothetical protein [Pontibacter sp. KCTC 32443]